MELVVYLAGQIHDDWRDEVKAKAQEKNLAITFVSPQTNHDRSDAVGEDIFFLLLFLSFITINITSK